jgi:adenylate cyclase
VEGEAMRQPSKILIVDDEPFNVDYLELELEDLGYTTVSARNGREALEHVAREAPDLILLDIRMPVMDGLTVCRTLKGDDETCLTALVIISFTPVRSLGDCVGPAYALRY